MAELKALLFDVDGTLADTERDGHRVAFNRAFADAGLDWHWDEPLYGELLAITGGKERIRHYLAQHRPDEDLPADLDGLIADLHAAKTRHYTELLATGAIPLRPGVERLLREAREAGLRLGVATTTTPANVTALLESTLGPESVEWFEVIAAGDIVPAKKPAPDIYHYALEHMGLGPGEALAFEDSANGVRSSVAASLPTVVTVNDYTRDHDFTGAVTVLDSLGEPGAPAFTLAGAALEEGVLDRAAAAALHRAGTED
ncbi:haloacid dehalogenase superfamily, subfamily IA, variant 3 with third motif having DD or ED [Thiohalospira halophila DSM 15071]|uniref:Haloacid dehalogenase superfamily, subfamily IA, variant 3 with third motif having DD or ED n=1 Tax=Thiohalospira halophila DSM 15071 TaxID=1123397 RepID=A0A1I1ND37_9GAMM|nr:HAD family hydrolase [Thiohalospira halophila]SFC95276.1 haloacid dehalogenase superfamily, subfamily IA, variant 3 with third motif having DD or ED [Thiohalospira halophila DSM 15071]